MKGDRVPYHDFRNKTLKYPHVRNFYKFQIRKLPCSVVDPSGYGSGSSISSESGSDSDPRSRVLMTKNGEKIQLIKNCNLLIHMPS
jgi:hypothetical protein